MTAPEVDKAGRSYWNERWRATPPSQVWNIRSNSLRHHVQRSLFAFMVDAFNRHGHSGQQEELIEVGCARSPVLPLFAKECGFRVAGLDYSPNGCEQARMILQREGISGEVWCADVFAIPENLVGRFDVVVSLGLVEHFKDSAGIVSALSRLLKRGGLMLTSVPNLAGTLGTIQKTLDRRVYEIHVPLTNHALRTAHEDAGLEVVHCDYFMSINFGVLNLNSIPRGSIEWLPKKVLLLALVLFSRLTWYLERLTGELPKGSTFSPYINCVAIKR